MGATLMKRGDFARLAKVSPAAVTQACRTDLSAAVIGNRIDASHPSAQEYLQNRPVEIDSHTGLDTFYYSAVQWCHTNRRYSIGAIERTFPIGRRRATGIFDMMRASGEIPNNGSSAVPDAPATAVIPSTLVAPVPGVVAGNGTGAAFDLEAIEIPEDIQAVADMSIRELIAQYGSNTRLKDWLDVLQKLEVIDEKRLKNAQTEGKLVARELVHSGVIVHMDATFRQMLTDGAKTIARRLKALNDSGADQVECENLVRDQIQSFIKPMKKKMAAALRNARS